MEKTTKQEILQLFSITDFMELSKKINIYSLKTLISKHENPYHIYYTPLGWTLDNLASIFFRMHHLLKEIDASEDTNLAHKED